MVGRVAGMGTGVAGHHRPRRCGRRGASAAWNRHGQSVRWTSSCSCCVGAGPRWPPVRRQALGRSLRRGGLLRVGRERHRRGDTAPTALRSVGEVSSTAELRRGPEAAAPGLAAKATMLWGLADGGGDPPAAAGTSLDGRHLAAGAQAVLPRLAGTLRDPGAIVVAVRTRSRITEAGLTRWLADPV